MWNGSGSCIQMGILWYFLGVNICPNPVLVIVAHYKTCIHPFIPDSIYTERYMRQPSENRDAYDVSFTIRNIYLLYGQVILYPNHKSDCAKNSTVTARAKNFQSVQYLLVHGTADGRFFWLSYLLLRFSHLKVFP